MKLELTRTYRKGEILDGELRVNGLLLCDTSENSYYAIEPGTYTVMRINCKQYCQYMPVIMIKGNSSGREGNKLACCADCTAIGETFLNTALPTYCPQIKMGNGIHNRRDGSIIIGTRIVPGAIKLSAAPFEKLMERMRKLSSRNRETTLTVIDNTINP